MAGNDSGAPGSVGPRRGRRQPGGPTGQAPNLWRSGSVSPRATGQIVVAEREWGIYIALVKQDLVVSLVLFS